LALSPQRRVSRLAGDGGKRARSPGRARRKPLKPLRRECRLFAVYLWLLRVCFLYAHAAAGASDTRHSLRPLCQMRVNQIKSSDATRRENADSWFATTTPSTSSRRTPGPIITGKYYLADCAPPPSTTVQAGGDGT